MYPEYKESDSIINFLKTSLNTINKKVEKSHKIDDIIPYVRILRDILEFRPQFLPHISQGGQRTGFRGISETTYNICGSILFQHADDNFTLYKKNLLEQLDILLKCIKPFPLSLYSRFGFPKWEYHHPHKNAPQYFYSYSHRDIISEKIIDVFRGIINHQIKFWMDNYDLNRFKKLPEELNKAINESKAAILLLSNNYLKSKWCNMEYRNAIQNKLQITILKIGKCDIPNELVDCYRTNLSNLPSPKSFSELLKLINYILRYEMSIR